MSLFPHLVDCCVALYQRVFTAIHLTCALNWDLLQPGSVILWAGIQVLGAASLPSFLLQSPSRRLASPSVSDQEGECFLCFGLRPRVRLCGACSSLIYSSDMALDLGDRRDAPRDQSIELHMIPQGLGMLARKIMLRGPTPFATVNPFGAHRQKIPSLVKVHASVH